MAGRTGIAQLFIATCGGHHQRKGGAHMNLHPAIKAELEVLEKQLPGCHRIDMDAYADLHGIKRINASRHVRRRGIPVTKEGNCLYLSLVDLAAYRASCKQGGQPFIMPPDPGRIGGGMKRPRGFGQRGTNTHMRV